MGQKAKDAAERARAQAEQAAAARRSVQPTASVVTTAPLMASTCPQCNVAITPADLFCGSCGHKLK